MIPDDATVRWEPIHVTPDYSSWQFLIPALVLAALLYGLWRFAGWAAEKYRDRISWRKLRWWCPTFMLVVGWALLPAMLWSRAGAVSGVLLAIIQPFAWLVWIFADLSPDRVPIWQQCAIGSIIAWTSWYVFIRVLEWRAWSNDPARLPTLY